MANNWPDTPVIYNRDSDNKKQTTPKGKKSTIGRVIIGRGIFSAEEAEVQG